jgi:hypothetical protein
MQLTNTHTIDTSHSLCWSKGSQAKTIHWNTHNQAEFDLQTVSTSDRTCWQSAKKRSTACRMVGFPRYMFCWNRSLSFEQILVQNYLPMHVLTKTLLHRLPKKVHQKPILVYIIYCLFYSGRDGKARTGGRARPRFA